jgi:hypothetical protein
LGYEAGRLFWIGCQPSWINTISRSLFVHF